MQQWSAAQFFAQLRPDAVKSMGLEEHGIKKLQCGVIPNSLDKLRIAAALQTGKPFGEG